MTKDGRAWLCESDGEIVGFVNGRLVQGDIWTLFLRQPHEGQGIGRVHNHSGEFREADA